MYIVQNPLVKTKNHVPLRENNTTHYTLIRYSRLLGYLQLRFLASEHTSTYGSFSMINFEYII